MFDADVITQMKIDVPECSRKNPLRGSQFQSTSGWIYNHRDTPCPPTPILPHRRAFKLKPDAFLFNLACLEHCFPTFSSTRQNFFHFSINWTDFRKGVAWEVLKKKSPVLFLSRFRALHLNKNSPKQKMFDDVAAKKRQDWYTLINIGSHQACITYLKNELRNLFWKRNKKKCAAIFYPRRNLNPAVAVAFINRSGSCWGGKKKKKNLKPIDKTTQ